MIEVMSASLVYLLLRQILQMLIQLARDDGAKDVELLGPAVSGRALASAGPPPRVASAGPDDPGGPVPAAAPGPAGRRSSSPRPRSGAGAVTCWLGTGPSHTPGLAGHRSTRSCACRSCIWPGPIQPGAIAASRASLPGWATRSRPVPCGRSCAMPESTPHRDGPGRPGRSSSPPRPHHPGLRLLHGRHCLLQADLRPVLPGGNSAPTGRTGVPASRTVGGCKVIM